MSSALDQVAITLARMCVFGPVVFLGLMMAMNPSSFASLLNDLVEVLAEGVRRFSLHLQGRWPEPLFRPVTFHRTQRGEAAVRLADVFLVVVGLLGLLELPG